jgi:Zn-dependent M28 family amino/carboxypeptidase
VRAPLLLLAIAAIAACAPSKARSPEAADSITAQDLKRHIQTLASPQFEGRAPGTPGEDLTVDYITRQFREAGLAPGNPDGSFVQQVPMRGVTSKAVLRIDDKTLVDGEDYALWSFGPQEDVRLEPSEMVFVGYGAVAPEYGWDDFKDVDVRGKTIVFLIGDPPLPDPAMFRGPAMTYYGRWTYKYEMAAKRGAAAALIVHEPGPAGYGWPVVGSNAGRERFEISTSGHVPAEGWLRSIPDYDKLKAAALRRDFRPMPLGTRASMQIKNTVREIQSRNVVARIQGSDPRVRDEHVIYSAHWDHLGRDNEKIYAGALDNASGVAWLLESAEAFTKLPHAPRRSLLFIAVTAEENGLLGSRYYVEHPLYPVARTLANINMDVMNAWGRTRKIVSLGKGQTTMDAILESEAARQHRTVAPDPESEKGYYYRSDHFEFARGGIPALGFLFPGADYIGQPEDFGRKKRQDYVSRVYHTPLDVPYDDWDLSGAVEDTQLLFRVGLRIADGDPWPEWQPGTEFRRRR